jgi:hypothetical protein
MHDDNNGLKKFHKLQFGIWRIVLCCVLCVVCCVFGGQTLKR